MPFLKIEDTDPLRSVCVAEARCVSSTCATRSPSRARLSSIVFSGLAGLKTGDVCRSKPVLGKAKKIKIKKRRIDFCIHQTSINI